MKLSIIVPVYNVEEFLGKCLDSLLSQDIPLSDYEIIIVNDGSTDRSVVIAEQYAEKSDNILVITQDNKGLGGARNTGIEKAKGEFMLFVDSDDTIQANCLNGLIRKMEESDLDILRFDYQAVRQDDTAILKTKNATYAANYSEDIIDGKEFVANRLGWACYVWVFMYKSDFLKQCKIPFEEHLFFEDLDWLPQILTRAKKISSIPTVVYFYLQRTASITQSVDIKKQKKLLTDKLGILDKYIYWAKNEKEHRALKKWYLAQISLIVIWMLTYSAKHFKQDLSDLLSDFKKRAIFPLKTYHFTWKQKLYVLLINISPRVYLTFIKV